MAVSMACTQLRPRPRCPAEAVLSLRLGLQPPQVLKQPQTAAKAELACGDCEERALQEALCGMWRDWGWRADWEMPAEAVVRGGAWL